MAKLYAELSDRLKYRQNVNRAIADEHGTQTRPPSASATLQCGIASCWRRCRASPMRRSAGWCRRLGAGLVVSEMTASDALVEGRPQRRAARRRAGHRHPRRAACRLRAALDGGGRAHRRRRGRRRSSTSTWAARPSTSPTAVRLGADARSRSCAHADRGDGRRGRRAGDAEDAARLGRSLDQRARARAARGGRRRPHDHACTAARAASSTPARPTGPRCARSRTAISIPLVVNGDITSFDDADAALAASGADAVMVGRARAGAAVVSRPDRALSRDRPARGARPPLADAVRARSRALRRDAGASRAAHRPQARPQASRLGARRRGRDRRRRARHAQGLAQHAC